MAKWYKGAQWTKKKLRPHKCLQINSCFILPLFPHQPRVPLIFPSIPPSPVPMCPCVQEPTLHFFLTLKPITSPQNSVQLEKPCHQPLLMQFSLISSFYAFYQILFIAETPFLFCPFSTQTTCSLSEDCLPHPQARQSSGNGCLPLRGRKTNVAGERSLHLEHTAAPCKPAAQEDASRGVILHLIALNGFSPLGICPTAFQAQIRFHIQNLLGRNSAA